MDDLYALDGGSSATAWQKRHQKRKTREAAKKLRQIIRAEAKADLAKRTKKWRERLKIQAAANKVAGLPPPNKCGRPRDMKKPQWVDLTGQRFGRQTVLRIAPVSKSRGRNRRWLVRCDCGSGDRLVAGTNLRQGITLSCGCLRNERHQENMKSGKLAEYWAKRAKDRARPITWHLLVLKRSFKLGSKDAKLISSVRRLIFDYEVRLGLRKPRRHAAGEHKPQKTLH